MIRRRTPVLIAVAVLLAVLASSVYWVSRPGRIPALLLDRIGKSLGLEISASGATEYRLRGTPMLLLRDVVARQPGAAEPLLRARRIYLSLPWSTIRARGGDLTVQRIELDAPQLDLAALQRWLATRPPSVETRLPTLTDGLRIIDGRVFNGDAQGSWRIEGFNADLPTLHPERPLQARVRGRYMDAPVSIPFELALALRNPRVLANGGSTGFGSNGRITIEQHDWRLPAQVALSGPLRWDKQALAIAPARFGMAARYESGDTSLPFALGLHGPLRFASATWTLVPAGVALRGEGMIPTLDAHGTLALARRLVLQLDGVIAQWPDAWPALPPPIGQSKSPLPFALRYIGEPGLSDVSSLRLQRDATTFVGRFRLPAVQDWLKDKKTSPLPPLDGRLVTPTLHISGAVLQGVEVEFDDGEASPASLP